jgi:hypothetical protein
MDWRQCAAVMQREAVTVMPSCSGGSNVVVVWSSSFWRSNYEGRLKSSWTGGSAPLLCRGRQTSIKISLFNCRIFVHGEEVIYLAELHCTIIGILILVIIIMITLWIINK